MLTGVLLLLWGCAGLPASKSDKIRDLEYTVLSKSEIPKELAEEIEMNKNSVFKITYTDGEYLYIANGYGEQETDGYCIQMQEVYQTENAIYFKSELFGPENGVTVNEKKTYPYVVVKLENLDYPVVFE